MAISALLLMLVLQAPQATPQPVSQTNVAVVFETELGNIVMEVHVVRAPITAANFLKYVDGKFYDGGVINRAVRPDNTGDWFMRFQVNFILPK